MAVPDGTIPMDEQILHETFDTEMAHFYVRQIMTDYPGMSHNAKMQFIKHQAEGMIATLTTWCVTGRVPSNEILEIVEWPNGPWQAFKEKYAPEWFKVRFPVRMSRREIKTVVNHYFVCPHLVTDPQRSHIKFMATGTRLAGRI